MSDEDSMAQMEEFHVDIERFWSEEVVKEEREKSAHVNIPVHFP
jgi:hypothetical protein